MKKLVLLLAVVFGVSFVACTEQKPAEGAEAAAADTTAVVEQAAPVVEDTTKKDSTNVEAAPAPAQEGEAAPAAEPAK